MKLSLVIPCYNEAANLPTLLERCKALGAHEGVEVILVDNGSTDSSANILEELLPKYPGCRSVRVQFNQGYGFGILSGLRAARGDILSWTHADLQTDPQDVLTGLDLFEGKTEGVFVKGNRYGRPLRDVLFSVGMSLFETVLLSKRMWDINAQPTMFSRRFFESWTSPPNDFALDLFVYYQARLQGLVVRRFPVRFAPRANGVSHWNVNWAAKKTFILRTVHFSINLKRNLSK